MTEIKDREETEVKTNMTPIIVCEEKTNEYIHIITSRK